MKALCIVASDNVAINGDVVFCKLQGVYAYSVEGRSNITIMNSYFCIRYTKNLPLKLKLLWFWHMVILRKDAVYLTGVLRK